MKNKFDAIFYAIQDNGMICYDRGMSGLLVQRAIIDHYIPRDIESQRVIQTHKRNNTKQILLEKNITCYITKNLL